MVRAFRAIYGSGSRLEQVVGTHGRFLPRNGSTATLTVRNTARLSFPYLDKTRKPNMNVPMRAMRGHMVELARVRYVLEFVAQPVDDRPAQLDPGFKEEKSGVVGLPK